MPDGCRAALSEGRAYVSRSSVTVMSAFSDTSQEFNARPAVTCVGDVHHQRFEGKRLLMAAIWGLRASLQASAPPRRIVSSQVDPGIPSSRSRTAARPRPATCTPSTDTNSSPSRLLTNGSINENITGNTKPIHEAGVPYTTCSMQSQRDRKLV